MSDKIYRCKGCGETNSIEEISVVPRVVRIDPPKAPDTSFEYDSKGWGDECFWEAETILGYGCNNDKCEHWSGNWGTPFAQNEDGSFVFNPANKLVDIAEEVTE